MFPTSKPARLLTAFSLFVLVGTSWISLQQADSVQTRQEDPKTDKLKLPPNFKAEHLYSPSDADQGSWVAMTFDDKGRMITSDQYGYLYRVDVPAIGSGQKAKVERLKISMANLPNDDPKKPKVEMGYAHGLLWAFNSLYVMINHRGDATLSRGSGLYRLTDTDSDGELDKITLIKELKGEGEHGPHSIVLSPDKKSLFVVCGNFTDLPKMDSYRLPSNWGDDAVFPKITDPRGHAVDRNAPGGWIAQIDPEGKRWELITAGFRNPYDITFNENGDLFAYDSDMEWDFGLPWYRPTRICHAVSGGEFGWRTGDQQWLPGNPDNLPPVLNIGQGSPTNLMSGHTARFPQKYKQSLFAFDWSFGIIYAIHLKPKGASYDADREEFLSGTPLPLTDGVIGPDGAMYFLTGGRRLESDLYRVYYTGAESTKPADKPAALPKERAVRLQLEQFHGEPNPQALAVAWPQLNNPDRFIRYAARIAVEHQPVAEWQEKVFTETDSRRLTHAAIALARQGDPSVKSRLLGALTKVNINQLPEDQQFDLMRAIELVFVRMGAPEAADKAKVIAMLNPMFPAKTALLNRGLSRILIYLEAPNVIPRTLKQMELATEPGINNLGLETSTASSDLILRNPQYGLDIAKMLEKVPPLQQTFYAVMLSRADQGWTPEFRNQYFGWFRKALQYQGGRSYIGFIDRARKLAIAHVPKDQVEKYNKLSGADLLTTSGNDIAASYTPKGPYRQWKVENAVAAVDTATGNRNFERGKQIYSAVLCSRCHSMRGEGGDIGPDLTQLGTRFSNKDILESIIVPDKVVSDQYAATIFTLKNGESVLGRLVSEDATNYVVSQNPFAPEVLKKVPKKNVVSKKYSAVSIMLPGLINTLGPDELRDLMAYLKAGGNPDAPAFKASGK
jgi:putative heme-binding domain-containing protein